MKDLDAATTCSMTFVGILSYGNFITPTSFSGPRSGIAESRKQATMKTDNADDKRHEGPGCCNYVQHDICGDFVSWELHNSDVIQRAT